MSPYDQPTVSVEEFKWPIGVTKPIDSPVSDVWAAISMPGNLELCHPFCDSNPVTVWPGPESRDEIHYLNGKVYQRQFLEWIDGVGYDIRIKERELGIAHVAWRVEAIDRNTSTLSINVHPHPLQGLPTSLRWLPHLVYLRPMLVQYLRSVVGGFDWYLRRREPVPRNQFGRHRWFSARGRPRPAGPPNGKWA